MPKATTEGEFIRKRRSVSVRNLKFKAAQGKLNGNERALIRMGKASTDVMLGLDDLSEWDEEELRRGRKRAVRKGKANFYGPDPVAVPKQCMDELARRITQQAQELMRDSLVEAVRVLTEMAKDPSFEAKDRVKAIEMIMNRTMGKDPVKLEAHVELPWMAALKGGIVSVPVTEDDEGDEDA
jgi:hypothetical protein